MQGGEAITDVTSQDEHRISVIRRGEGVQPRHVGFDIDVDIRQSKNTQRIALGWMCHGMFDFLLEGMTYPMPPSLANLRRK